MPFVHFEHDYAPRVAAHHPTECSANCKKLLFLKPHGRLVPEMNKAGYLDIRKVHELPLSCINSYRDPDQRIWRLRDCSFSLIADLARDAIATHFTSWQPRHETEVLCKKLDHTYLEDNGLICWVEPASKKLVDSNGTSYTGCGPCVVIQKSASVVTVCVVRAKNF